jgi:(E)-4-hydroxy-3-methylbut-2-enyl-diphosphate synthase
MKISRHKTKVIKIGNVYIGGNNPIAIQSMTKTKTVDIEKTVTQIKELEGLGCQIVRLAVKDEQDAKAIRKIKEKVTLPIVADIHFNWRLGIAAIDNGADKIRLNPGNIYKKKELKEIIGALKLAKIPLRVGINSGSVKDLNSKRLSMSDKLVASALNYLKTIEKFNFYNLVLSLKASSVLDTVEANRKIARLCDYPLHLGITATGSPYNGAIKSSIAMGVLLLEGIGDTIRVSLTDEPVQEVVAAKSILESLELRSFGPKIISCPTCGRCEVDLVGIVKKLEERLQATSYKLQARQLKVAVMGCIVNGPGEARDADIGIAFGKKAGLLFRNGKPVRKISSDKCVGMLIEEILKSNQKSEYRNQKNLFL